MPKGIPLTKEQQQIRRKEIFDATVHLFLEKGFNETSMGEIARAAGMGKSTLYDYFKSKDEILISYYADQIEKITGAGKEIVSQELSTAEKLKGIMRMHLAYLLDNKKFHFKLSAETQRLSAESQKFLQEQRADYRQLLRTVIEEGIQTGEFREVNVNFASRSIYTLLSIAVFSCPDASPEEIMQEALSIFFSGIQQ